MLALKHITKHFGAVTALDNVSAEFAAGRVHGVLGENGAGKTTLMRVAAGLCVPDSGDVFVDDRRLEPGSPLAAARAGIAMVHQHFMLVPTLTVVENCLIGRRALPQRFNPAEMARKLVNLAAHLGLEVDPHARIDSLSVGQAQRVEIIRALWESPQVLILDEPTAVLAPQEIDQLFRAIARLRRDGIAVIFISHKLREVERICDDLTILRQGRCTCQAAAGGLTVDQMAEKMVGRDVPAFVPQRSPASRIQEPPAPVFRLDHVSATDAESGRFVHELSLEVRPGEIMGLAGVEGNGQDVLAALIVGLIAPRAGNIILDGRDISRLNPAGRRRAGIAHIAEDRRRQALVPDMALSENLVLTTYHHPEFARAGWLKMKAIRAHAERQLGAYDVRAPSAAGPVRSLSGGNQQKLVLARELAGQPRFILAHNPGRGLDVAATRMVFEQLFEQRRRGAGILLMHSDLDELLSLADRVGVLYKGRCRMTTWPDEDRTRIGRWMMGVEP